MGKRTAGASRPASRRTAPLRFVDFALPTLVEKPPEGAGWLHEVKYDGYRTELIIEPSHKVRALTRRAFDWTDKYAPIVEAAARIRGVTSAIVDGEVIVMDEKGRSDSPRCARRSVGSRGGWCSSPSTSCTLTARICVRGRCGSGASGCRR